MYRRRVFELTLGGIALQVTGAGRSKKSQHGVTADLLWPRPAIAARTAVSTVTLHEGATDMSGSSWCDRILFKETVQGPFGIELCVTERMSSQALRLFVADFSATVLKTMASGVQGMAAGAAAGALLKLPFLHLGRLAAEAGKAPARVIAGGSLDLSADDEWAAGEMRRLEIPLVAPCAIYRTVRTRRAGRPATKRTTVLKAGQPNGSATVVGKLYS